jgi:hypothetical protein
MDQTCPVVHKSRRPQARLKTVTVFYIHCATYSYTCNDDRKRTYLRQKKDMAWHYQISNFEFIRSCGLPLPYVRTFTDCTCCDFGHLRFMETFFFFSLRSKNKPLVMGSPEERTLKIVPHLLYNIYRPFMIKRIS